MSGGRKLHCKIWSCVFLDQKVVFCPLSKVQEDIYKTLLQTNDVQLVLKQGEPCDCRSELTRGKCCYAVCCNTKCRDIYPYFILASPTKRIQDLVVGVAQLVRALHRNRRTAGSIPAMQRAYSFIFD